MATAAIAWVAVVGLASIALYKTSDQVEAAGSPKLPETSSVQPTLSEDEYAEPESPAKQIITYGAISKDTNSPLTEEFLSLSIVCRGNVEVTIEEFLQMRGRQAQGDGIVLGYLIDTAVIDDESYVVLTELALDDTGRKLGSIPPLTRYNYRLKAGELRFLDSDPPTDQPDPITSFGTHSYAACNLKIMSTAPRVRSEANSSGRRGTITLSPRVSTTKVPDDSHQQAPSNSNPEEAAPADTDQE